MSLLSICQNAANDAGVNVPTSIIGNADPAAARLLQMARRTGRDMAERVNWTALTVEHVFVANGTSDYTLPADFRSLVNDTLWDRSRFWRMRGAMSPQQWQLFKSSIIGRATIERRWRLRLPSGSPAGATVQFEIDPPITGDTTSTFVYEYVSRNWCISLANVTQPDWVADTDVSLLDESVLELGVIWRLLHRLGLDYSVEKDEFDYRLDMLVARDGGTAILDIAPYDRLTLIGPYNVPETGFGP
jgi:hypothetical protein